MNCVRWWCVDKLVILCWVLLNVRVLFFENEMLVFYWNGEVVFVIVGVVYVMYDIVDNVLLDYFFIMEKECYFFIGLV